MTKWVQMEEMAGKFLCPIFWLVVYSQHKIKVFKKKQPTS